MKPFESKRMPRLIFGAGKVERVGACCRELGGSKVLLVTDKGIVQAGHADRVRGYLEAAGCAVTVFDKSIENPTTECVSQCTKVAREADVEIIVGLGGGSSMDTGKGCNFILTNGGEMKDYWGHNKAAKPMLPFIAVPTTAGTGSECQSFALISDAKTHVKMACGDDKALPAYAILDPDLTATQPPSVTACTGIDALAHALESAVSKARTEFSYVYSREAFGLIESSLEAVLDGGLADEARGRMLLGAAYSGLAIENSMLGAAHASANPLTARYNVVHGQAVGVMMPHVMRFNIPDDTVAAIYADLGRSAGIAAQEGSTSEAAWALIRRVDQLVNACGFELSLAKMGIAQDIIPTMAEEAGEQWTGTFNPRPVSKRDFIQLYLDAHAHSYAAEDEVLSGT